MGSIVSSTGYMVLQRPVEPAGLLRIWLQSPHTASRFTILPTSTIIAPIRHLPHDLPGRHYDESLRTADDPIRDIVADSCLSDGVWQRIRPNPREIVRASDHI